MPRLVRSRDGMQAPRRRASRRLLRPPASELYRLADSLAAQRDSFALHFTSKMHSISTACCPAATHADGAAHADAGVLAEHLRHQFREAVDDLRLILEVRRAVDHAERLDQPLDLVERAERRRAPCRGCSGRPPGRLLALLQRQVGADLPATGVLSVILAGPWPET